MKHLLLSTFLVLPTTLLAQSAQDVFSLGVSEIATKGLTVEISQGQMVGDSYVVQDFSIFPKNPQRKWEIWSQEMTVSYDDDVLTLLPTGSMKLAVRLAPGKAPFIFDVSHENFKMVSEFSASSVSLVEFTADDLEMNIENGEGKISISDFVFRDEESGLGVEQLIEWRGMDVDLSFVSHEGINVDIQGDLGELSTEWEIMRGGYLEEYPWVAAISTGMEVEVSGKMGRSQLGITVQESDSQTPSVSVVNIGRSEMSSMQNRSEMSLSFELEGIEGTHVTPDGIRNHWDLDATTAGMVFPFFGTGNQQTASLDVDTSGLMSFGSSEDLPFSLSVDADAGMEVFVDWLDHNLVTGEANWRRPELVFDMRTLTAAADMVLGNDGYEFDMKVSEEASPRPSGLDFELGSGEISFVTTQTSQVMDFMGKSGLFTPLQNEGIVTLFSRLFGPDAGLSGGAATVELESGKLNLNGYQ